MTDAEFKRLFWGPRLNPAEQKRLAAEGKFLVEECGWPNPDVTGFLRGALVHGNVDSSFMFRLGKCFRFNRRSIRRAAERLNIQRTFTGRGSSRKVFWSLPSAIDDKSVIDKLPRPQAGEER